MKTILLIAITTFSITALSQTGMDRQTKQYRNMFGAPYKIPSPASDVQYSPLSPMTLYPYDTVRAIAEVNDIGYADAYPWISADGLRLYYTSGANNNQMMFTQRADGHSYFEPPVIIPVLMMNSLSYWLSADELDLYFSDGFILYKAHRDSIPASFETPVTISLSGIGYPFIAGQSLNSAQDELFIYYSDYPVEEGIMQLTKSGTNAFTYARTLPAPPGYAIEVGQLSKDDLTIIFSATYNNQSTLLYQMTRTSLADSFKVNTFQQIQGINDTSVLNVQPSVSDSMNWVAFVRNEGYSWDGNDLYLAYNGRTTSVFDPEDLQIASSAYPNPSSGVLFIRYKALSGGPVILSVFSSSGKLIYESNFSAANGVIKLDTHLFGNGFYCYRLTQSGNRKSSSGTGKFTVLH